MSIAVQWSQWNFRRLLSFQTSMLAVNTTNKRNIFVHLPLLNQNISVSFTAFLLCL
jgi:hypothetical protein